VDLAEKTVARWGEIMARDGKISLHEECVIFSMLSIMKTSLGIDSQNTEKILKIKKAYETVWHDMEVRVGGSFPAVGSEREANFIESKKFLLKTVEDIIENTNNNGDKMCFYRLY